MLVVRNEQIRILDRLPREAFEADLAAHFTRYYPAECRRAGRDQLLKFVQSGIGRAFMHGYNTRRDIGAYLTLMMMLGHDFVRDPQIPWALRQVNDAAIEDSFARIGAAFQSARKYLEQCFGRDNGQMARTLVRVRDFDLADAPASEGVQLRDDLCDLLKRFSPHKFDVQGEEANRALIALGVDRAEQYGIETSAGATVFVALMFLLGAGFDTDPLYPWGGHALRAARDEQTKIAALHGAAIAYVKDVLTE